MTDNATESNQVETKMYSNLIATYTLLVPFCRGGEEIKTVQINKPTTGHLRGVMLLSVINMDIEACAPVLVRCSPQFRFEKEIYDLDIRDAANLMGCLVNFFNASR